MTIQEFPTTINRRKNEDGSYSSTGYTNNDYDHFSFTREMNEKMSLRSERIDAVNKYYGNEQEAFNKYRKEVSDHVPVALTINLKKN